MPEVYNWQLGRKMLYPYEERHPKWQFTFVFNINRCIACQTCSMADKSTWLFSKGQEYMWWNNVETKPYGGYPQFYDVKVAQLVEQVNPGGQVWNTRVGRKHHAPYGVFEGFTIFDAGAKIGQAAIGNIPTDEEWRGRATIHRTWSRTLESAGTATEWGIIWVATLMLHGPSPSEGPTVLLLTQPRFHAGTFTGGL